MHWPEECPITVLYRCARRTARLRLVCRFMDFRETRSWRRLGWGTFDEMKLQGVFRWTRLLVSVVCTFWNLTTTVVDGRGADRRPGRILFWRGTVSRRSSIAFPSDSVVLLTRERINGKRQQNSLSRHPRRERTPRKGKRVSPVKDQLRTVMKLTLMFLLRVQLRQHLIYTTTVMVLITNHLQAMVGALRRAVINTIIVAV